MDFDQVVNPLINDPRFWARVRVAIAVDRHQMADDALDQHRGELCECQHPAHDHECVDGWVGPCLECWCQGFNDEMVGPW